MSQPHFHRSRPRFCVSDALDALGEDIAQIRHEDGLTWEDIGRGLGKGKDRAQDYAKGLSDMPVSAFLLGCREWNGRFAGRVLAMIGKRLADLNTSADHTSDRAKESSVLKAALGYWTRANSEFCLLATRGKPKRQAGDVRQGIIEPRREHSRKPDCVHERIQRLVDGPYLELFARTQRPGWTAWGNETDKFEAAA